MGVLDKIKLVEMARKIKPNAAQERRAKLGEQLHEQLKMAQAMLNGTTCERTKSTWAKDAEGNRVSVETRILERQFLGIGLDETGLGAEAPALRPLGADPQHVGIDVAHRAGQGQAGALVGASLHGGAA